MFVPGRPQLSTSARTTRRKAGALCLAARFIETLSSWRLCWSPCRPSPSLNTMVDEDMAEAGAGHGMVEGLMPTIASTAAGTWADTPMAPIPATTVIEDMGVIGPITVGTSAIPAIMAMAAITVITTTTTMRGLRLAQVSWES